MLKVATKLKPNLPAMEIARAAGFRYAELWTDGSLLEQWQEIVELAQATELQCRVHFPNRGELSHECLRGAVQLYRDLNASAMVIHRPMLQRYGDQLLEQAPDLRLGVENHKLTQEEFWQWASENSWLTLDVEHVWMLTLQDAPLERLVNFVGDFLDQFGHKLVHVHMPGYLPGGYGEHRPMYCSREMIYAMLDLFAEHKFDGFIVSEINLEFQNRLEMEMDVLLVERWSEISRSRNEQYQVSK